MGKKEEKRMSRKVNIKRPCTISESIIQSCIEVSKMRSGALPERSLDELFRKMEKWIEEERR